MKKLFILGLLFVISTIHSEELIESNDNSIHISKVESAVISSIRQLTEQDLERDKNRNWALFSNSLLGGVLGYQYGNGSSNDIKSILVKILAHNQKKQEGNALTSAVKIRLTELQVVFSDGERKSIILSTQTGKVYRTRDKIRLVHFETGVFVDKI